MKNMRYITKIMATLLITATLTPTLSYAGDGSVGTTSTGTSTVTVTIPELVSITGVGNLSQTYNGTTAFDQNDPVCIYSNMDTGGAGTYTVTASATYTDSGGAQSGFFVGNAGTTDKVAYTVAWNDSATAGTTDLTAGASTGHTGWTNDPACGGGNNANFRVQMTNGNLRAVHPAAYSSTLSLVISPVP